MTRRRRRRMNHHTTQTMNHWVVKTMKMRMTMTMVLVLMVWMNCWVVGRRMNP